MTAILASPFSVYRGWNGINGIPDEVSSKYCMVGPGEGPRHKILPHCGHGFCEQFLAVRALEDSPATDS